jgi:hypothetical protein
MYYVLRRPMPSGPLCFLDNSTGSTSNPLKGCSSKDRIYCAAGSHRIHRRSRGLCETSTAVRNLRTFWTVRGVFRKYSRTIPLINFRQCVLIAADYKLNFRPGKSDYISALHERVGDRLLNLFTSNGGLYIKFGVSYILIIDKDVPRHT